MLYISPRLLKALLYPLSLTLLYLPNLFLIVGQHDHVAYPVLEGHSPEVQHCVLFWTLNHEDFEGIQLRKKCDCVLFWTLNNEDFEGTRPKPAYGRQGLDWIVGPQLTSFD